MVGRAELRFLTGEKAGQVVPLDGGRTVIGRQVGDVILGDSEVSSIHAIVSFEQGAWKVMDLGSTNGVFVDGVQVAEATLPGTCELKIGQTLLRFEALAEEAGEDEEAPRPASEQTAKIRSPLRGMRSVVVGGPVDLGIGRTRSAAPLDADTEEIPLSGTESGDSHRQRETRFEIVLEVLEGADRGLVYRFDSDAILLGRLNTDLVVRDSDVSRRHAIIEVFGDEVYLRDLNSTNGTWVNGRRVSTSRLRTGDRIKLGRCVLSFGFHFGGGRR